MKTIFLTFSLFVLTVNILGQRYNLHTFLGSNTPSEEKMIDEYSNTFFNGDFEAATKQFEYLYVENKVYSNALNYALCLAVTGKNKEALEIISIVDLNDLDDVEQAKSYFVLANTYTILDKKADAEDNYYKSIDNSACWNLNVYTALINLNVSDTLKLIKIMESSLHCDTDQEFELLSLYIAHLYLLQKNHQKCIEWIDRYKENGVQNILFLNSLLIKYWMSLYSLNQEKEYLDNADSAFKTIRKLLKKHSGYYSSNLIDKREIDYLKMLIDYSRGKKKKACSCCSELNTFLSNSQYLNDLTITCD